MSIDEWRDLYLQYGFFWNEELSAFVTAYAGLTIEYPGTGAEEVEQANFCLPDDIELGRDFIQNVSLAEYLEEKVAPVGNCDRQHIDLVLTESGRLFGCHSAWVFQFGSDPAWRAAVVSLLRGERETLVGTLSPK